MLGSKRDISRYRKNYINWVNSLNIRQVEKTAMINAKDIYINICQSRTKELREELERLTPSPIKNVALAQFNGKKRCLKYYIYYEENVTRIVKLYEERYRRG